MRKRFIVEFGMGIDLHGQDATRASCKAVQDAISYGCLCGLEELLEIKDFNSIFVDITIAVPQPDQVDQEAVMREVPFGHKTVKVVPGGLTAPTLFVPQLGDKNEDAVVAVAAVTVSVDVG